MWCGRQCGEREALQLAGANQVSTPRPIATPPAASTPTGEFAAAHGYPSLSQATTGVPTGTEREGSGRSSAREKQRRWYEKLKADPVRLAAFREKYNAAAKVRYHADRTDPAKVERHRASRRKAGKKLWQKDKHNPAKLERRRKCANKRCEELRDEYVAERLKLTPDACPRELLQLKRAHLQLQREIRNQYGSK